MKQSKQKDTVKQKYFESQYVNVVNNYTDAFPFFFYIGK